MERNRSIRWMLPSLAGFAGLAVLALIGLPRPSADPAAALLRERAAQALAAGRIGEAELLAGQVLALEESADGLVLLGEVRLRRVDPAGARIAFARALRSAPEHREARLGLAEACLDLLRPEEALSLAGEVRLQTPDDARAWALEIRCLLDLGQALEALRLSQASLVRFAEPPAELLAAGGAALFRGRRVSEAAQIYRKALARDPLLLEPHLRLGSGLLPGQELPRPLSPPGLAELERGQPILAIPLLMDALNRNEGDPSLHRLLGEALQAARLRDSFMASHPVAARLHALFPDPDPGPVALDRLFPAYPGLGRERRAQVQRAAALWAAYLPGLLRAGGRHDILARAESATQAWERARLKGRKTADGRYWDHVRGLGGLHAATGVEALDQAHHLGFNTLVHELTHQVHLFVMGEETRAKVEALFAAARREGRCLDYYAATCVEEYLAQGAEAFVSLAKRPDSRRTYSHTRFELMALDPALDTFLRAHASWDPLEGPQRLPLLEAAAEYALLAGRPDQALTALALLGADLPVHAADLRDQALLDRPSGLRSGVP